MAEPDSARAQAAMPASTSPAAPASSLPADHDPFDPSKATLIDRTETGDIYRNADGTNTLRAYGGPVNFRDAKGAWQRIDERLTNRPGGYRNTAGPFDVLLPVRAARDTVFEIRKGAVSIKVGVEGIADRPGQAKENRLTFDDGLPGTDVTVQVLSSSVQQLFVLADRAAVPAGARWRLPLDLRGVTARNEVGGAVGFRDDKGELVALMPPGTAFDSAEHDTGATAVNVSVVDEGRAIEVTVDAAWLADPARAYPVTVDPQMNMGHGRGTSGYDAFAGSGCGNCNYDGGNQFNGTAHVDKVGYTNYAGGFWQFYSYIYYDISPANGADILRGYWNGYFWRATGSFSQWRVTEPWQPWQITWGSLRNHSGDRIDGAPGTGYFYTRDMTYWVAQWARSAWPNYGIAMNTAGRTGDYLEMSSNEMAYQGTQSYIDVYYNHGPQVPTNLSPAAGTRVGNRTPQLSAVYRHNNAGEPGICLFELWNASLTTHIGTYSSGSLQNRDTTCTRTLSSTTVAWNTTYQWRVFGKDQQGREGPRSGFMTFTTPSPPPAPPTAAATPVACTTSATVTWTAPSDDGGTAITGYRIRAYNPDGSYTGVSKTVASTARTTTIDNLARGASYYFGVAATNAAGTGAERATANIAIITTPTAPQNVSATAGSSGTTAEVSWLPPASNGGSAVTGYTVRAYDAAGTFTGNAVTKDGAATSATMEGLTPGATYGFGVTATNCAGDGPESGRATTTQPTVSTAPQDVSATGGVGTITAQWAPPTSDGGTPVTGYDAHLYRADGTDTGMDSGPLSPLARSHAFSGLPKATSYYVVVRARNGVGQSAGAQSGVATTKDTPSAPQAVSATGGVGSITGTWSAPASDGGTAVTGYSARLFKADGTDTGLDSGMLSSGRFSYTFDDLPPATAYYVVVTPYNAVGAGSTARSGDASTADFPGLARDVAAVHGVTPGTADVSWQPPTSDGGAPVTGYTVRTYNADGSPSGVPAVTVCGTCTAAMVVGLSPSRGYLFGVTATNGVGDGAEARTASPLGTPGAFTMVKSYQPLADEPLGVGHAVAYQLAITNSYATEQRPATLVDTVPPTLAAEGTVVDVSYVAGGQARTQSARCTTTQPSGETLGCLLGTLTADGSRPISILNMPAFTGEATVTFPVVVEGDAGDCASATNAAAGTDTGGGTFASSVPLTFCDTGLGLEPWWNTVSRPIGPMGTASVNTANGNLVVTQTDSAPVQAHGRLAYVLRRSYNSQDTTIATLPGSLGAGWSLNVSEVGDSVDGGLGSTRLYVPPAGSPALNALAVTLIDRDGTRHVFRPKGLSAALPLTAVPSAATPKAITAAVGTTLCVDETFSSPAGVHVGLWRYLQVTAVEPGSCAPASGTTPQVLGFGAERTDRTRYEFDATGRMLSMQDAAGVELRYLYEPVSGLPLAQLTAVFEPGSCTTAVGIPTTRDAIPTTCRAFRLAYEAQPAPSIGTKHIDVTDPAGRVTRYAFDAVTSGPQHLLSVTNPDGSILHYTYGGCGGTADQLCSASDPRGGITSFAYAEAGLGRRPKVARLQDRRDNDPADANGLPVTFAYGEGTATIVQGGHQTVVQGIDAAGRAAQVEEGETPAAGASTWTVLRRTENSWDTRSAPCRAPDNGVDNNLCRRVRRSLRAGSPDEETSWLYNPEGRVLRERKVLDGQATLDQTFGYRTQSVGQTATTVTDDTVTGGGNVSAGVRPNGASTLFVLSDMTESLTPRGNQAADHQPYLTTHKVDNASSVRPNTVPLPVGGAPAVCANPAAPTSNTGLVCETVAPAFDATGRPTVTRTTYDRFGQKATTTTAQAVAEGATTDRVDCPVYGTTRLACYTYSYYDDFDAQTGAGNRDLSGSVSAGGWLKAVTDPDDNFVAFAYDRGGNVARTWDRNATEGRSVGDPWDNAASPPTDRYSEMLRGPLSAPWRYQLSARDPLGNLATTVVDANGNATSTTPPRGNAPGNTVNHATTQTFDAGDNVLTRTAPVEAAPTPKPWRWTYDGFGNKVVERNPNNKVTAWTYDAVNREVERRWSRTADAAQAPAACPEAPDGDPLFDGSYVCSTTIGYDGVDNARELQDGNDVTTTVTFDAVHRAITTSVPRTIDGSGNVVAAGRTDTRYDADGRVTDVCSPRLFAEGDGICNATSLFSTHTAYDVAGRAASVRTYRQAGQPLVTTTTYDADGNAVSTLDANGNATVPADASRRVTADYDLLGRKRSQSSPRGTTTSHATTWHYDPVGNTTAVVQPGDGTTARTTAYSYDELNRPVDTVVGADSTVAAAAGLPSGDGGTNVRTRLAYDPDGNVVARYNPRAFVPYGNVADPRQAPNPAFMVRTDYDADGRETAQYTPRFDGSSAASSGPSPTPGQQCPNVAPYPADVGVCVTRMSYDAVGNRTDIVLPTAAQSSNRHVELAYTDDNLPSSIVAPSPVTEGSRITTAKRTYDGAGRVVQVTDALNHSTTTEHSADGLVVKTIGEPGVTGTGATLTHVSRFEYDANGNRTNAIDAAGHTSTTSYFADDTISAVEDGGDNRTEYVYDANGNPTRVYAPSAVAADPQNDNNTAGIPTVNTYTHDNLLATSIVPIAVGGGERRRVTYSYDPAGRKTTQHTHRVLVTPATAHDPATATVAVVADGGAQAFTYFPNDRPHTETGRSLATGAVATGTITFAYDAAGNRTSVSDSTGSVPALSATYYLDDLVRSVADGARTTTYQYDGAGKRVAVVDAAAGGAGSNAIEYRYGDAGLPRAAASTRIGAGSDPGGAERWEWQHDAAGRLTSESDPSGRTSTATWNADDTLARFRVARGATSVADWSYTYDELYRILTQGLPAGTPGAGGGTAGSAGTYAYTYDAAGRLDSFTDPLGRRTIAYDRNGNRVDYGKAGDSYTGTPKARHFTYNADDSIASEQVDGATPMAYSYSAAGNLSTDGQNCFRYDGFDRTADARAVLLAGCSPTVSATYGYDGLDRRRSFTEGPRTTSIHYEGMGNAILAEDVAAVGVPTVGRSYVIGPNGTPKAMREATGLSYLSQDGTGNVTTLTNSSGAVVCTARFDPFGDPQGTTTTDPHGVCNSGTTENGVFYRGARRDDSTGTYQFGARTYDPAKAAFTSPDSYRSDGNGKDLAVGVDPLTRNTYTYVNGDPVNLVDPDGHEPWWQCPDGDCDPWNPNTDSTPAGMGMVNQEESMQLRRRRMLPPVAQQSADGTLVAPPAGCLVIDCGPSIADYEAEIMMWAEEFGLDPTLVAAIIQHEGGNVQKWGMFFRPLEDLAGQIPEGLPKISDYKVDSFGIAQIQVDTADKLLREKFGMEMSKDDIAKRLINDDRFSIALASAALSDIRARVAEPYRNNVNIFTAYAAGSTSIEALNSSGWDLGKAKLGEGTRATLQRRATTHWSNALQPILMMQEFGHRFGGLHSDGRYYGRDPTYALA